MLNDAWTYYTMIEEGKPISVEETFGNRLIVALLLCKSVETLKNKLGSLKKLNYLSEIRQFALDNGFEYIAIRQQVDVPDQLFSIV